MHDYLSTTNISCVKFSWVATTHGNILTQKFYKQKKFWTKNFPESQHKHSLYVLFCYQMSIKGCKLRKVQEFTYGQGANCLGQMIWNTPRTRLYRTRNQSIPMPFHEHVRQAVPGQVQTHLEKCHMKEVLATVFGSTQPTLCTTLTANNTKNV